MAVLVSLALVSFIPLAQLSQPSASDAALRAINSPGATWFPADYRDWNQSSAWKPQGSSFLWDRPSCSAAQTCLAVKVLTRDDCDLLAVSASLANPSTGQTVSATASIQKVEAGHEQNLTLRWDLPPAQLNGTLAREFTRKTQIETLADHQGNASLQELAVAHIGAKLISAPPAWQSVTIEEIRCL
jgi:hypothetical protein